MNTEYQTPAYTHSETPAEPEPQPVVDGPFFKIVGGQPVPIELGERDGAMGIDEVELRFAWPHSVLIALHRMFFPVADEEMDPWFEALSHPPVAELLKQLGSTVADLHPKFLLLAMLRHWQTVGDADKLALIREAIDIETVKAAE